MLYWIGSSHQISGKNIPSKVFLFAWRLLRNRLSIKDNLAQRSILQNDDLACVADCGNAETTHHLFIQCAFSDIIWQHVRVWLGIDFVATNTLHNHFVQFSSIAGMPRSTHIFFKVICLACIWVLWKERNNRIFKKYDFRPLSSY